MSAATCLSLGLTWAILGSLYLLLAGSASPDECVAAATTALAGTAIALLVRRCAGNSFQFARTAWLPPLGRALAHAPREALLVAAGLAGSRPTIGQWHLAAAPSPAPGQDAATARALFCLTASFAPNRYAIAAVKHGQVLTHRLVRSDSP